MFKELPDKIDQSQLEKEVISYWKSNDIFKKSISTREGKPSFTFYEGPPTANGKP
ncbi:MAG TPA: class I tRNA ligase family protein, partial [Ignavibacteria bacterium]|nr:class I tRNA ligase family protein [Ignavibacteria bacterium]